MNIKILNATRKEEEEWRIKSRKLWLKGGYINKKYFHKQEKVRKSFSIIKELKYIDGNNIVGQEEVKAHSFNHFLELYIDREEDDPEAQSNLLSRIPTLINE